MAPLNPTAVLGALGAGLLSLGIGFLFGFALEQAGFGDSRKLAAQFYLRDMTVLKVMFTAIVVAMLLLSVFSGFHLVDLDKVWVNPTYLWPGILGGLILGFGFIIGGYCPGTSLVSLATLKLDGLFFVLGTLTGILLFSETVDFFAIFFNYSGAYGRLTIPDLLGLDPKLVVSGIVVTALLVFVGVERVELMFKKDRQLEPSSARPRKAAALVLLAGAVLVLFAGQPTLQAKLAWLEPELDKQLESRQFHIDPGELLSLMHNNRIRLELFDVRSEADYNQFHLLDARHVPPGKLDAAWIRNLPPEAVKVVMSNDESQAGQVWKYLTARGVPGVYILEGGINEWLEIYGTAAARPLPEKVHEEDRLRFTFPRVLGSSDQAARPDLKDSPERDFTPKVKVLKPVPMEGGGCG
ncbi:MAG TPA: YeeE/YedE thiosulfate transporter family protein [archaeon]|nr:YeeE/YedE thiosulfate transporter family protein [archaeon]